MTVPAEYAAHEGLNWSLIKHARRSLLHFRHAETHPPEANGRMVLGSLTDCVTLTPWTFESDYVVWAGGRKQGAKWEAFQAEALGRTVVTPDELATANAMRDAIRSHPHAGPALEYGTPQVPVYWTDPETGIACKGLIDWLGGTVLDLKSTANIDPWTFSALAFRYGYFHQVAFYRWGLECSTGVTEMPCQILAVESEPPHDVALYTLNEIDLSRALDEVRDLLRRIADARSTGKYPGRFQGEVTLETPRYAWSDEDAADELGLVIRGAA